VRVVLVTDALGPTPRGNRTTVERWLAHARKTDLVAVPPDPDLKLDPAPDVVHGYHALHGGLAARAIADRYACPLVISLGGTDLYALLRQEEEAAIVEAVLRAATCITGAFDSFGEILEERLGLTCYVTVPRGVHVPTWARPKPPDGRLDVLLPSGLRPVKDPMFAIELATRLSERGLPLSLRVLGPSLDDAYVRRLLERSGNGEFIPFGEVPPERMAEAYGAADVVWNTALHEGGANVMLEAIAHGCALFARDVPGNHDFLKGADAPGRLFDPRDLDAAEAFHRDLLLETPAQRHARAVQGLGWLKRNHDASREAEALERVWLEATSARAP
jgi:glycosyltransferase involved in cell wall biosynthesis